MFHKKTTRGPYRSRQETEQLLLEAGLELISEGSGSGAFDRVTAKEVAELAGLSTGAIYSRWGNLEGFYRDILIYQLNVKESRSPINFMELFAELPDGKVKGSEIIRSSGTLELEHQRDNPAWGSVLVAWVLRADDAVREAARTRYVTSRDASDALVEQSLHYSGRRLRKGLKASDLAVSMTALVDGLTLRHRVDPELVDTEIKWPPEAKHPIDWSLVSVGGDCLITYFTEPIEGKDLREYWSPPQS